MQLATLIASVLLLSGPLGAMEPSAQPTSIQDLADAFVDAKSAPGIAIGVLDESGRIRTYCAGTLEVGGGQPVTENTIFEIGSITKVFTATLAHLLEQQGELSLSDPVGVHLPEEVDVKVVDGNEMTLWHLATHTSGLPRRPSRLNSDQSYYPFRLDQLYEFLENWKPDRAPGGAYDYSNLGFGLLGLILELNQEASYDELVQRHILSKLKMRSTGCMLEEPIEDRLATPHRGTQPTSTRDWTRPTAGAGGIKSSVKDLMLFAKANLSDSESPLHRSLRSCQVPRAGAGSPKERIGLGWHVLQESNERIIHHGGSTRGFRSFMAFMPDRGHAVVLLANSTSGLKGIGLRILAPDVFFDEYAGSYQKESGQRLLIENRNGELFLKMSGQRRGAVFRLIGEDLYLNNEARATLRFERGAQGRVRRVFLKQKYRDKKGREAETRDQEFIKLVT